MMSENEIFWHKSQNCPVVYVASTCFPQNSSPDKVGCGICWGFDDQRNCTAEVSGVQNEVRGELTGLKKTLEIAINTKVTKLVIRMKWQPIVDELEKWEASTEKSQLEFPNFQLLTDIDKLFNQGKEYMYWLEEPHKSQMGGINFAMEMAKIKVKCPSPVKTIQNFSSVSKKGSLTPPPSPVLSNIGKCAITGLCSFEGGAEPLASYAVHWGLNDKRNRFGMLEGQQTSYLAEFQALKIALQMALNERITHLCVLTRSLAMKRGMFEGGKKSQKIEVVEECQELATKLEGFYIQLIDKKIPNELLDAARLQASEINNNNRAKRLQTVISNLSRTTEEFCGKFGRIVISGVEKNNIPVNVRTVTCAIPSQLQNTTLEVTGVSRRKFAPLFPNENETTKFQSTTSELTVTTRRRYLPLYPEETDYDEEW